MCCSWLQVEKTLSAGIAPTRGQAQGSKPFFAGLSFRSPNSRSAWQLACSPLSESSVLIPLRSICMRLFSTVSFSCQSLASFITDSRISLARLAPARWMVTGAALKSRGGFLYLSKSCSRSSHGKIFL